MNKNTIEAMLVEDVVKDYIGVIVLKEGPPTKE